MRHPLRAFSRNGPEKLRRKGSCVFQCALWAKSGLKHRSSVGANEVIEPVGALLPTKCVFV
jgi:hypothetical protein